MGNHISYESMIEFEELQSIVLNEQTNVMLVNTMTKDNQSCLIKNTLDISEEEKEINKALTDKRNHTTIILYGKNYHDERILKRHKQLKNLGLKKVRVYYGGVFEWLCLQEIYGFELFPTTTNEIDILKYK